jgi:hypothetical protein
MDSETGRDDSHSISDLNNVEAEQEDDNDEGECKGINLPKGVTTCVDCQR